VVICAALIVSFVPALPDAFLTFSPTGKVPCLIDSGLVVWDSLGIVEFLAEQYPQVWPDERAARAWARCASAEMHSGFAMLRAICTMNCGLRVRIATFPAGLQRDIDRIDQLWNEGLDRFGGPFLAGEQFSAVDAFFAPVAFRMQTYGLAMSPRALQYAEQLRQRPAMREWYTAAVQEMWRDAEHEDEVRHVGVILQDLRVN
jgi:glutathione S-transferase